MAIPAINVLGNPNVTEGNFQVAIEDLRKSVIGSGKAYDSSNTYSQYDTCVSGGIVYYSKINSNTGNTPTVGVNWGLIGDLINLLITNGTALGYGTGSGGSVKQDTSKTTSVALNKPSGQITMNNATLAAGQGTSFSFLNSLIGINDNLKLTPKGVINYDIDVIDIYNGAATIRIINKDSISHSDAIAINFAIIKGAIE